MNCLLYRDCPLLEVSFNGGFTSLYLFQLQYTFLIFHRAWRQFLGSVKHRQYGCLVLILYQLAKILDVFPS